jgi:hypothetical protein
MDYGNGVWKLEPTLYYAKKSLQPTVDVTMVAMRSVRYFFKLLISCDILCQVKINPHQQQVQVQSRYTLASHPFRIIRTNAV